MSDERPQLAYLFEAELADGSVFKQTPEDKSMSTEGKNCYYDLLHCEKEIIKFSIVGKGNRATVNLKTGLFEVNGLPVLLESIKLPAFPEKFELVWYHQVTRDMKVTRDNKTGKTINTEFMSEFREYFIGWKCNMKGKEYIQKLALA